MYHQTLRLTLDHFWYVPWYLNSTELVELQNVLIKTRWWQSGVVKNDLKSHLCHMWLRCHGVLKYMLIWLFYIIYLRRTYKEICLHIFSWYQFFCVYCTVNTSRAYDLSKRLLLFFLGFVIPTSYLLLCHLVNQIMIWPLPLTIKALASLQSQYCLGRTSMHWPHWYSIRSRDKYLQNISVLLTVSNNGPLASILWNFNR